MKTRIKIFIVATVFFSLVFSASELVAELNSSDFHYSLNLYYDQGKLTNDRDEKFPYQIVAAPFTAQNKTPASYKGVVYSGKGGELQEFYFDPRGGNSQLTKGKVKVSAPYYANAKEIILFNAQGVRIHSVDVSGSSFCDDDGACEEAYGENNLNCPNDCKTTALPSVSPTTSGPVSAGGGGISTIQWTTYSAIGLVVLAIILRIWAWYQSRRSVNPTQESPNPSGGSAGQK